MLETRLVPSGTTDLLTPPASQDPAVSTSITYSPPSKPVVDATTVVHASSPALITPTVALT
jgi:hypothetical protein